MYLQDYDPDHFDCSSSCDNYSPHVINILQSINISLTMDRQTLRQTDKLNAGQLYNSSF